MGGAERTVHPCDAMGSGEANNEACSLRSTVWRAAETGGGNGRRNGEAGGGRRPLRAPRSNEPASSEPRGRDPLIQCRNGRPIRRSAGVRMAADLRPAIPTRPAPAIVKASLPSIRCPPRQERPPCQLRNYRWFDHELVQEPGLAPLLGERGGLRRRCHRSGPRVRARRGTTCWTRSAGPARSCSPTPSPTTRWTWPPASGICSSCWGWASTSSCDGGWTRCRP